MLRFEVEEETLLKSVSASLRSLTPEARGAHEPVARHRCVTYKCRNGICPYGYPVVEACDRTRREIQTLANVGEVVVDTGSGEVDPLLEERVLYRREIGTELAEKDEYVTPFCVELSSTRVCHGAFLICTDELATGYTGKYVFKRSGAWGPTQDSYLCPISCEEVMCSC